MSRLRLLPCARVGIPLTKKAVVIREVDIVVEKVFTVGCVGICTVGAHTTQNMLFDSFKETESQNYLLLLG